MNSTFGQALSRNAPFNLRRISVYVKKSYKISPRLFSQLNRFQNNICVKRKCLPINFHIRNLHNFSANNKIFKNDCSNLKYKKFNPSHKVFHMSNFNVSSEMSNKLEISTKDVTSNSDMKDLVKDSPIAGMKVNFEINMLNISDIMKNYEKTDINKNMVVPMQLYASVNGTVDVLPKDLIEKNMTSDEKSLEFTKMISSVVTNISSHAFQKILRTKIPMQNVIVNFIINHNDDVADSKGNSSTNHTAESKGPRHKTKDTGKVTVSKFSHGSFQKCSETNRNFSKYTKSKKNFSKCLCNIHTFEPNRKEDKPKQELPPSSDPHPSTISLCTTFVRSRKKKAKYPNCPKKRCKPCPAPKSSWSCGPPKKKCKIENSWCGSFKKTVCDMSTVSFPLNLPTIEGTSSEFQKYEKSLLYWS